MPEGWIYSHRSRLRRDEPSEADRADGFRAMQSGREGENRVLDAQQLISLLGTLAEAEKRETSPVASGIGKTVIGETNALTPDEMKQLSQDIWDQISKNKARDRKRKSE